MSVVESGGKLLFSSGAIIQLGPSGIPNRMGGLISAGGGGSYASEWHPTWKNKLREGFFTTGTTLDVNGWPTNAHGFLISTAPGAIPPWASGTFKCGFIGSGTPSNLNNGVVANIVFGNGTTTYTTFDLTVTNSNFGFSNSAAANNIFAYLPAYPGSAIDDPTNPNSITNEAITLYGGLHHIRTEWHGVALWNSRLMTSGNRNTPSNTQTYNFDTPWFGNQTATLGGLPGLGATSSTLSGWKRGAGTWCFTFNESGVFEGRICTVGTGANPTISWTGGLTAAATSTSITYGVEGYPLEWILALAVAANTGLVICEPTLQDGNNNVAGSYTAATMALVNTYATNYPAWTGHVYWTPGNENWNGAYNSFRVFTESARLGGFTDKFSYGGAWMHALANLGRTQFGAAWSVRFGSVLEWQLAQPNQFYNSFNYMISQSWTPSDDISYIATAPYMNPTGLSAGSTIAQIQTAMATNASTQAALSKAENTAIMGLHYGIPLMSYEDNAQWSSGTYSGITNLQAAIMDPGYITPMETFYNNLANSGFQLFSRSTLGVASALTGGVGTSLELGNLYPVTRANTPSWEALMSVATSNPNFTRNVINGSGSIILGGNYADQTGAANPAFPGGTFLTIYGSPYYPAAGYIGWFFNSTVSFTYTQLSITCAGSGTPLTNVEIGGLTGFTIPISGTTLASGVNNLGSITIPTGPGYILLGNGTPQSTLTISQLKFN